ncbi:MAG: hypothetical protein WC966_01695 [Bradymonadales bacterium]|jgi:hypothetical protein
MKKSSFRIFFAISLLLPFSLVACDEHDHHDENHAHAHICEHFKHLSASMAVSAVADAAQAPELPAAHKLYKLSLEGGSAEAGYSGFVKINANQAVDIILATNDDDLGVSAKKEEAALGVEKEANSECDLKHHEIDLDSVGTVVLELKAKKKEVVILYEYEHDEHEEHHHH